MGQDDKDGGGVIVYFLGFFWILSILIAGFVGYQIGHQAPVVATNKQSEIALLPTNIPTPTHSLPTQTPVDLESICDTSGPSQKKDYLTAYILKEGDSLQSIAEKELGDLKRVSELTNLNEDQRNLTVGSTIYLPPSSIKNSSGHLVEVSGKIVKKDNASWQLTYGGGVDGPGIMIPGYYLKDIPNLDQYQVGDCVTIFLDNGVKAYSVRKI